MNRDKAIKQIQKAGNLSVEHTEDFYDSIVPKPTVPQYVADWYEDINYDFYGNLECRTWDKFELLAENNNYIPEKPLADDFTRWYYNTENAIQILVNMHQFGYEVEEEKKYRVILKGNSESPDYLVDTVTNGFRFYNNIYTKKREHTRKELEEAGFGWVFDCEGIEIEEVEE